MRVIKENYPFYAAVSGSFMLLAGAYAFQYGGGLLPCELCYYQRYPHWVVIVLGLVFFRLGANPVANRAIKAMVVLALLTAASLAFYHVGVEYHWWQGPGACTAALPDFSSTQQMMQALILRPVVRCDEPAWSLLGLSMAAYHGLAAFGLALWLGVAMALDLRHKR